MVITTWTIKKCNKYSSLNQMKNCAINFQAITRDQEYILHNLYHISLVN